MPNAIEQSYLAQGYRLPDGLTWQTVDAHRSKWDIDPVLVPVAIGHGCIGWAVPFIDGKPLKHP